MLYYVPAKVKLGSTFLADDPSTLASPLPRRAGLIHMNEGDAFLHLELKSVCNMDLVSKVSFSGHFPTFTRTLSFIIYLDS